MRGRAGTFRTKALSFPFLLAFLQQMIFDFHTHPWLLDRHLRALDARMRGAPPPVGSFSPKVNSGCLDVVVNRGGEEPLDRRHLRRHASGSGDLRLRGPQSGIRNDCSMDVPANGRRRALCGCGGRAKEPIEGGFPL